MYSTSTNRKDNAMKILKSEKGVATFLNLFVRVLVACFLIMLTINVAGLLVHYQNVNFIARELTKVVEQDGRVDTQFLNIRLNQLNDELNCEATFEVVPENSYFTCDGQSKCIQYRDDFTMYVTDTHILKVSDKLGHEFTITADQDGKSEVFWKI